MIVENSMLQKLPNTVVRVTGMNDKDHESTTLYLTSILRSSIDELPNWSYQSIEVLRQAASLLFGHGNVRSV